MLCYRATDHGKGESRTGAANDPPIPFLSKLGVLPNRKHAEFRFLCQDRTQNSTLIVI